MSELMFALAGIFDTLVIAIYFCGIFKKKWARGTYVSIGVVSAIWFVISYFLSVYHLQIGVVIASLLSLFFLSCAFEGKLGSRIFHVIFTQVLAMVSELVAVFVGQLIPGMLPKGELEVQSVELVISKLFFFVFIIFVLTIRKKQEIMPTRFLLYFSLVPFMSLFVVYGLANGQGIALSFSLLAILALNIIAYYLLYLLASFAANEARDEMLGEQIRNQRENYEKLSQSFKQGNKLLHDVNKHLRQVGALLEVKKWGDALDYIARIEDAMYKNFHVVNCGNVVIDSILSNLKNQLDEQGNILVLELHVDSAKIMLDDYDLVTVLGNLADNISEAVKEQKNANVYIRIETTEDEFLIYTKNPVSKERHKKKNPWFHGLGLQNVTSVVEQYGGCAEYNKKQEEFENMILIPYVSEGEEENETK